MRKHREEDEQGQPSAHRQKEAQQADTMRAHVKKIKAWLKDNDDKPAKSGGAKKSNITDNDSAKMKTSHGVLQGYDGVATVDAKHQVVVHAQAFGEAQEHDLLLPMVAATRENFQAIGQDEDVFEHTALATDSGFHTEDNVQALFEQKIDAYIADNQFRKRDPRFATANRHRARTWPSSGRVKQAVIARRTSFMMLRARLVFALPGKRSTATAAVAGSGAMKR